MLYFMEISFLADKHISSWRDRIPFVLLFGIATSVDLFHDRLSRRATRCVFGAQFDVEQTSSIVERVFTKVVISADARLRLGSALVSSLMERQYDHVQSVQAFIAALKYSYMCHFYANPLAVFLGMSDDPKAVRKVLQDEHFEALRNLPSFRLRIQDLLEQNEPEHARKMLEDDEKLLDEAMASMNARDHSIRDMLRALHVLASSSKVLSVNVQIFMEAFTGSIYDSGTITKVINAIKRMGPEPLLETTQKIIGAIQEGNQELGLDPWDDDAADFVKSMKDIQVQTEKLVEEADEANVPIRSKYSAQHKVLRTTVIAQKVQLSHDSAKLSHHDVEFTSLVDRLIELLRNYFTIISPQNDFMNEIWLYDHRSPYRDVFTPRPRFVIERALSAPHEYIDTSIEELSSAKPATALLYEMYLENGSLINVFDLWSAFSHQMSSDDDEGNNERETLALFYRALADLKSLGMVKHSKKKTDHLAKLAWKGL
ncbi:hypothetical protein BP5796_07498 [Coleophoma crateriformis]|uniref:Origin recognition complex subunit 3 n=1 Tax=Coleophoma crateriformis TaxID=565419 RepID=A0A3D8RJB7_9HELO|nr:hypothetical protein BP5796_07498 [Coleophoma crateriformis]